ncbi:HNH endonuclease [Pseudomonas sp. Marseille-QA0892]
MQYHLFNIGSPWTQNLWDWMLTEGVVTLGYRNEAGDAGEAKMRTLAPGDMVIAYANDAGYLGIGMVSTPFNYQLVSDAEVPAHTGSGHRHWLKVDWVKTVKLVRDALPISVGDQRVPHHGVEKLAESTATKIEAALSGAIELSGNKYWWVNHKQTSRSELEGGYIWSPKKNANGRRNQTYENLLVVEPGDIVFSYAATKIRAIGRVTARAHEAAKPQFGSAGENWDDLGWRVAIEWTQLDHPLIPKEHISAIAPLLPEKHAPIRPDGNGNQGCYLAGISQDLGELLLGLAGRNVVEGGSLSAELEAFQAEELAQKQLLQDSSISATTKQQLVEARIGQGRFRSAVLRIEHKCRVTGLADERFLIASHIKPWKDCDNAERLDGNNGLMLAPHIDKLFDRGWITFTDAGALVAKPDAQVALSAWGIAPGINVGPFNSQQASYLAYHRSDVYAK